LKPVIALYGTDAFVTTPRGLFVSPFSYIIVVASQIFHMVSRNMKTIEHPPIMDFYRNSVDIVEGGGAARPSMLQLIHGDKQTTLQYRSIRKFSPPPTQARVKFGWIQGVFVRCLLNIFGVMLYLRISWVAGQAGIGLGSIIVLLASLVTTITAISTCAICTNGDVKGGGAYFLISRSLGPEFGGSIGLIFSVANAVGAAMYIVGFAETVRDLLKESSMQIIDAGLWDVRLVGFVTCIVLIGIVFIGTAFESRMQMILLVILLTSIIDYIIGSFFPPSTATTLRGATGYRCDTLMENLLPAFRDGEDFFSVFAVYFPAATGIMAGANISGDLADPQRAIPIGTLLAIAVTTAVYLATVWMTGSTCPNFGIFAATLSSALASLVSAPKVFQAVCKDRLFPKIGYFAKGYGKNEEPRRAYFLTFIIAVAMVGIGDLNAIAPIISNFFLASYALINYACFDASFADSPGFRPGFKYYNMWVSLGGALLCIVVMFIISWATALITFFCFAALFLYILHRKPDVNWGSSTQAHSYKNALSGMIKLSNTEEHVKNYRPQLLVLCGNAASRPSLVDFANSITKGTSLMICGYVVPYNPSDRVYSVMRKLERQLSEWLRKRRVKSFYASVANSSLRAGAQSLLQVCGLGKLRPNIVLIGFKTNWYHGGPTLQTLDELNEYFGTIQDAFDSNVAVCVLRNGDMGLDFSEAMKLLNVGETKRLDINLDVNVVDKDGSVLLVKQYTKICLALRYRDSVRSVELELLHQRSIYIYIYIYIYTYIYVRSLKQNRSLRLYCFSTRRPTTEQKALIASISLHAELYLSTLRVFTISTSTRTMEQEQRSMAALLSKFRINFSDVSVISDIGRIPRPDTLMRWEKLIAPFVNANDCEVVTGTTSRSELDSQRQKTYRQLRASELLREHSAESDLVVITLPVPRKGMVSASLYLSWLDMMTRELPPTLLVRGNQTSVLTFYS
uniref:AA_permease domain-containing protein n=1 Tax=Angiostrongylus cantonensis TaxID=6313 RepID=A0A158PAY2_ANGCA